MTRRQVGNLLSDPLQTSETQRKYEQKIHEKPIAEGLVARTPAESNDYIEGNPLLDRWLDDSPLECTVRSPSRIQEALDHLLTDGFRYVIVRNQGDAWELFRPYFPALPAYQDDELLVYQLADVRRSPPCQAEQMPIDRPDVSVTSLLDRIRSSPLAMNSSDQLTITGQLVIISPS